MKSKSITGTKRNMVNRLGKWALFVAAALMIPLVGRAPWTITDFIFAGGVLFGAASVYELTTRNAEDKTRRVMIGVAIGFVVFLIWGWAVA